MTATQTKTVKPQDLFDLDGATGRWTEAVRLGTPALVIQAGAMSRPILDRAGFETVCRIQVLEDPAV